MALEQKIIKMKETKLKLIIVLIYVQLFPLVNQSRAELLTISEVMSGVEYCEVQIVCDQIDDTPVQLTRDNVCTTCTLIFVIRKYLKIQFTRDLSRTRESPCKVSFLIEKYFFHGIETPKIGFYWASISYLYGHKMYKSFEVEDTNAFNILLSAGAKENVQKLYSYDDALLRFRYRRKINFGIIFLLGNKSFNLCVHPGDTISNSISDMNCKCGVKSLLHMLDDMYPAVNIWSFYDSGNGITSKTIQNLHNFDIMPENYNPFNQTGSYSLYEYIIQIVFRKANSSLHYESVSPRYKYRTQLSLTKIVLDPLRLDIEWKKTFVVPLKFVGKQFISCYYESFISFGFYLAPFQHAVWGCCVATFVCLVITLSLYIKLKHEFSREPFSPWLFVLASIFEEPVLIPVKLEKKMFIRIVIGSWILMSIMLINCYNGLMISDLNSPFPRKNMPETFQDLICENKQFIKYRNVTGDLKQFPEDDKFSCFDPSPTFMGLNRCFKIFSPPIETWFRFFQNSVESTACHY